MMKGTIQKYSMNDAYSSVHRRDTEHWQVSEGEAATEHGYLLVESTRHIASGQSHTRLRMIYKGAKYEYRNNKFYQPRYLVTLAKRFAEEVVKGAEE
jgi:hypothetical protein